MITEVLYIDNDVMDILAFQQVITHFDGTEVTVCKSLHHLQTIHLDRFDAIICDSNLPDANYLNLKLHLASYPNVQFVSNTSIDGEPIWLKPITKENLEGLCCFKKVIELDYIDSLAMGDRQYELEMLTTALSVLPERLKEMDMAQMDLLSLKRAAHRTKSLYRVCGIDPTFLNEIESMDHFSFTDKARVNQIIKYVRTTIFKAIRELESLIAQRSKQSA